MDQTSTLTLRSGSRMPVLGLGTWQLTDDTAGTVAHALELRYRMIDTASDYRTQPGIGEAIRRTGTDRESVYVVAKVEETDEPYGATRTYVSEMGLERADLMLIHRPPAAGSGRELWKGLIRAKQDGLTKDIGVSNYTIAQIRELADATGEMPVVNQIEWSPFGHSDEMRTFCREAGIVIQAYSPLTRAKRLDEPALAEAARRYGKTPAQLLIRWNLELGTAPLPKANRWAHLEENLDVFDFELGGDGIAELDRLNEHYSSLAGLPYV